MWDLSIMYVIICVKHACKIQQSMLNVFDRVVVEYIL